MYQHFRSTSNANKQRQLIETRIMTEYKAKYGKIHDRIHLKLNILITLSVVKLLTVVIYH